METGRSQASTRPCHGRIWAIIAFAMITHVAHATPTIDITSVEQRWPWNNKLDISYLVRDGQDVSNNEFYRLEFVATIGGVQYLIDGVTNVGASAASGPHTVTWMLPAGLRTTNCTMVASIYPADGPSGDDYMIIDLDSGKVSYEGLLASQGDSNVRYNKDEYKNAKLVLRKVPAGGTYPTGDNKNYSTVNGVTNWVTDLDFYVGIFPVTQAQYIRLCGKNPSGWSKNYNNNYSATEITNRPAEAVSYYMLRGENAIPTDEVGSKADGTFLERLNALTGMGGFDLPTEVMHEIAQRAGVTNVFSWGNSGDLEVIEQYAIGSTNNGNSRNNNTGVSVAVGSLLPNNWGLYDTSGNCWEWCRDDGSLSNLKDAPDPWTPAYMPGTTDFRRRGGGHCRDSLTAVGTRASTRGSTQAGTTTSWMNGFRVYRIMR